MRYEIDPHNRLVVYGAPGGSGPKRSDVRGFRHVVEGRFKIGKGNTLEYHIKAPSGMWGAAGPAGSPGAAAQKLPHPPSARLPHQMKFKGTWQLTKDHNLRLTFDKWRRQTFGDSITLKGDIIAVAAHELSFAVTERTKEYVTSTHILKFEGSWQADKKNRLTFRMRRETAGYDILTFDGIWEVDGRNRIVYNYERRLSSLGRRKNQTLVFNGFWNYAKKKVITYQLDVEGKSAFEFKVGRGIAEDGAIRFEAGIGASRKGSPVKKEIILYGRWNIKKGSGLVFETRHAGGRLSAMKFQAEAKLMGGSRLKFALRSEDGRALGTELEISKSMLKGSGESFVRFLRSREERAVYIGSGFTW